MLSLKSCTILLYLLFGLAFSQDASLSSKLAYELLEMFAPQPKSTTTLPYNFNKNLDPKPQIAEKTSASKLTRTFIEMLMPTTTAPKPAPNFLDIFQVPAMDPGMTPTKPQSALNNILPNLFNPIIPNQSPFTPDFSMDPVFPAGLAKQQAEMGLDRLLVKQGAAATPKDDMLGNILGGPWQEKGIKWAENGNILLVNRSGNKFLGSDVATRDRTVEIPMKQWINMASSMLDMATGPRE